MDEAIKLLAVEIDNSDARINVQDAIPTLSIDRHLFIRVMQNIIGNSLKYAGDIAPQIDITMSEDENEYMLVVADNGVGIAPEDVERIFLPLERGDTCPTYDGCGIGLAICDRIVKAHEGKIRAKSRESGGTTIYFTLPIRQ